MTAGKSVQPASGALNLAADSALHNGSSAWQVCTSGVSSAAPLFQKNVASPAVVAGSQRSLIFPDAGEHHVILIVPANARQMLEYRNSPTPQLLLIADAGLHENLGCVDRS